MSKLAVMGSDTLSERFSEVLDRDYVIEDIGYIHGLKYVVVYYTEMCHRAAYVKVGNYNSVTKEKIDKEVEQIKDMEFYTMGGVSFTDVIESNSHFYIGQTTNEYWVGIDAGHLCHGVDIKSKEVYGVPITSYNREIHNRKKRPHVTQREMTQAVEELAKAILNIKFPYISYPLVQHLLSSKHLGKPRFITISYPPAYFGLKEIKVIAGVDDE